RSRRRAARAGSSPPAHALVVVQRLADRPAGVDPVEHAVDGDVVGDVAAATAGAYAGGGGQGRGEAVGHDVGHAAHGAADRTDVLEPDLEALEGVQTEVAEHARGGRDAQDALDRAGDRVAHPAGGVADPAHGPV